MVALRAVRVAAHAAGVTRYRGQSGVGGQPVRGAERRGQVTAGVGEQFRPENGPNPSTLVMISACRCWANPAGEQLVQVLDLAVQVQQLLGEPGDQRRGDRLTGQRQVLLDCDGDRGGL